VTRLAGGAWRGIVHHQGVLVDLDVALHQPR
jgi:hypothetical protein